MQERKIVIEQKAEEKKRKREAEYEEPSKPFKKHKPKDKNVVDVKMLAERVKRKTTQTKHLDKQSPAKLLF